jgi:hypothetical protein
MSEIKPKKVEVVEPNGVRGWAFKADGVERYEGDVFTHPNGQHYIDLGWCKCVETGEVGERKTGVSKLQPHNVKTPLTPKPAGKSK